MIGEYDPAFYCHTQLTQLTSVVAVQLALRKAVILLLPSYYLMQITFLAAVQLSVSKAEIRLGYYLI